MRRTAALILGGGPAGAAAAIALAMRGSRATVIERTRDPADALCGGFLSWRTLATLERLGIAPDTLNPATVTRLRLFAGTRSGSATLPAPARAVSRARLDRVLLDRAAALGAGIERGVAVRAIDDGVARLADGAELTGDAVLLATGKHDLRGSPRDAAINADPALGLRIHLPGDVMPADTIELHLFDGGYAGLAVQEDGRANLCMAVARSRLRAAGDPIALLSRLAAENPALARRLDRLDPATPVDSIANVPYGWRATAATPGLYRLGDQAAVIPSLAGEGIGIAVASGIAAADAILTGTDAVRFQPDFARRTARPVHAAGAIRTVAATSAGAALLTGLVQLPAAARIAAGLTRIS